MPRREFYLEGGLFIETLVHIYQYCRLGIVQQYACS